ncbi:uncharacterized protein LOC121393946 [Xenopus laevis]|uniref:Uncharacterized protein LOC121393946 n=1 Tax=Xenopus laevis TaxID=8355 RepID=A0A8J1KQZ8_XENLA|nr:uncharacterized protein LOC121393946 [Xenopus laevis]
MAHFVPLSGVPSAPSTAEVFIKEVVRLHGVPDEIVSDRGVQFTSKFWRALCKALKIKMALSTAFHPQSNGQTERTNQTLEQYLRCFSSFLQDNWSELLPLAEFSYNNALHSSIKQTPFFANYGFHPHVLPNLPKGIEVPAVQERLSFLLDNTLRIQQTMAQAQSNFKDFADRKRRKGSEFRVGDLVWLSTRHIKLPCPSKKLGQRFLGPFPIIRRVNEVTFKLKLPATYRIHPVFHVALLKPVVKNTFSGRDHSPPAPVTIEGVEEFEVEAILDSRYRRGRLQYLIQWKGFPPEENSWEPVSNLHAPQLIELFHRSHPNRPAPTCTRRLHFEGGQCRDPEDLAQAEPTSPQACASTPAFVAVSSACPDARSAVSLCLATSCTVISELQEVAQQSGIGQQEEETDKPGKGKPGRESHKVEKDRDLRVAVGPRELEGPTKAIRCRDRAFWSRKRTETESGLEHEQVWLESQQTLTLAQKECLYKWQLRTGESSLSG